MKQVAVGSSLMCNKSYLFVVATVMAWLCELASVAAGYCRAICVYDPYVCLPVW